MTTTLRSTGISDLVSILMGQEEAYIDVGQRESLARYTTKPEYARDLFVYILKEGPVEIPEKTLGSFVDERKQLIPVNDLILAFQALEAIDFVKHDKFTKSYTPKKLTDINYENLSEILSRRKAQKKLYEKKPESGKPMSVILSEGLDETFVSSTADMGSFDHVYGPRLEYIKGDIKSKLNGTDEKILIEKKDLIVSKMSELFTTVLEACKSGKKETEILPLYRRERDIILNELGLKSSN